MTLERRLRQHFQMAGAGIDEPEADLQRVVQRGRRRRSVQQAAVAAATLSIGVLAVLGLQGMSRSNVEFAPAAPPATATPSPAPQPSGAPSPTPRPSQSTQAPAPVVPSIDPRNLGATVMAYGANDGLSVIDGAGAERAWSEPVAVAFPDARGGVVLQTRAGDVVWVPDASPGSRLDYVTDAAARGERELTLRGVDPGGSILFSTRPAKRYDEGITERFFAVPLDGAGGPELLSTEGAYESWSVGPAAAADGHVMASCHLLCSLYRWPHEDDTFPFPDAVYHGGGGKGGPNAAIEALTATPDGRLLAFVEDRDMVDQVPDLVVLDGATFKERLRLPLPVGKKTGIGGAVVSPSSDGQRILVSVDPPRQATAPVPRTTYLVDDALTGEPVVRRVNVRGVVRWLDPGSVQRK